ncbi:MAG TPA: hypothetical protein VM553_13225, partial [Dongiaceae bacterium]|nr:hypothetical protein [Dongiaceae bacterium]
MWKIRTLVMLAAASAWLASPALRADSFDDAVNLYLKGFDQCAEAKSALGANDLAKARSAFAKYESTRQKAVALDKTILTSSQRGMDSNLKYCNRVGTDIEVATGMPTLDKALAACDLANADLKAGKLDTAKTNYQQFIGLRDEALALAPSLNNVFSARSEIRRCERLETKIAGFGKEQAALTMAVQSAMDDSETLQTACESALTQLNDAELNPQALQAGRQALTKAQAHQKIVAVDIAAVEKLKKGAAVPEQKALDSRVAKGTQCVGQLTAAVATKDRQLQTAQADLDRRGTQLKKANQTCSAITAIDSNRATQA